MKSPPAGTKIYAQIKKRRREPPGTQDSRHPRAHREPSARTIAPFGRQAPLATPIPLGNRSLREWASLWPQRRQNGNEPVNAANSLQVCAPYVLFAWRSRSAHGGDQKDRPYILAIALLARCAPCISHMSVFALRANGRAESSTLRGRPALAHKLNAATSRRCAHPALNAVPRCNPNRPAAPSCASTRPDSAAVTASGAPSRSPSSPPKQALPRPAPKP